MKYSRLSTAIFTWAAIASDVSASAIELTNPRSLSSRALPANAPYGYTPQRNDCPSNPPSIRSAATLSDEETSWLQIRRQAAIDPMRDLLSRLNIQGFDVDGYISSNQDNIRNLPNIGIAFSGGGYRALLNGAGVLEAFDSRTPNATNAGHVGGLLQSATYMSGLSGGSWLVGSLYSNNFLSVNDILAQNTGDDESNGIWELGNSILEGPDEGIALLSTADYYSTIEDAVDGKRAGYNVSLTDYWGRALSYQLVQAPNGGPAYTWSSIADQDFFTNGSVPMPFIVADEREPGQTIVSTNATVYHFDPWELGSEDPTLYGFVPLQYAGTNFTAGSPSSDECTTGFDNVGFVMGTSSSLFNVFLPTVNGASAQGGLQEALQSVLTDLLRAIGEDNDDVSFWNNPFYQYNNDTNPNAMETQLSLVDGGLDLQNIPLHPLIQPDRHVDVIFAIDSSADTNDSFPTGGSAANWPDGASLRATYERSRSDIGNNTAFPNIPDVNTFFNLGLNARPTFFGCDPNDSVGSGTPPLIVYMPNAPYVYNANISTFQLTINDTERNAVVQNGYYLGTQGNGTIDTDWPACVGCAILSRSLERTGTDVPDVCSQCFNRYCWDGTTDNSVPDSYTPAMKRPGQAVNVSESGGLRLSGSLLLSLAGVLLVSLVLA